MRKENGQAYMELPLFQRPFRVRVQECWKYFLEKEGELRHLIDQHAGGEAIGAMLKDLLSPAFQEVYAEVGFHKGKYDLILNLEGDWARLFPLTYFRNQAPKEVFQRWNVFVGRQSREERLSNYQLKIGEDIVCAQDIRVWTAWSEKKVRAGFYCESILPLLPEREDSAYWIAYTMLDYAIGELAEMKYICELELLRAPGEGPSLPLTQLRPHFMEHLGLGLVELYDADRYCQIYSGYQMEPSEDADDGSRKDAYVGSSCFFPLLREYWNEDSHTMNTFFNDGIAAGYFCYPLHDFQGEDRSAKILDFRDDMADQIEQLAGRACFTYTGGATGIYCGYLDFIAWDLKAVLDAAADVFQRTKIDWVMFHSFRQDAKGILLFERVPQNQGH